MIRNLTIIETLGDKKRSAKDLAALINKSKKEIDSTKAVLEKMRSERIAEGMEILCFF